MKSCAPKAQCLERALTTPRWPSDIEYLQTQRYAPSIPSNVLLLIQGAGISSDSGKHTNHNTTVVVRVIDDPSHPASGQRGLYASRKIPPSVHILDYLGEVHCDDRPDSDYDLSLYRSQDGRINVGVDASKMGNEARFVNDYRGIKPKPNAMFKDERPASGELRMSIWSDTQGIRKGEEILVSYGKAWWRTRRNIDGIPSPSLRS